MALEDEFVMIEKQINRLLVAYKENSDDYKVIGMLDECDALKIIDGSIKVIRKQLEIITRDYSLDKKQIAKIDDFLDKMRKKLNDEVLNEDILVHDYGVHRNRFGIVEERTIDEAYHDFIYESKEKLDSIFVQKMRLRNFNDRKKNEKARYWIPIIISSVISIFSLVISLIALHVGGLK